MIRPVVKEKNVASIATSEMVSIPKISHSKREESRLQIIEAAIKLIVEQGYHEISMKEVAVRSGVSRATLYRYYSTKEQLYTDAASYWAKNFVNQIRNYPPCADTAGERVTDLIERTVNAVANSTNLMAAYIATMVTNDPSLKSDPRYQQPLMPIVLRIAMNHTKSKNLELAAAVMQHILISNLLLLNSGKINRQVFIDEMCDVSKKLLSDAWKKS